MEVNDSPSYETESEGLLHFERDTPVDGIAPVVQSLPQQWGLPTLLCIFSFLSFFDPSQPFLVTYFTQVKGLTQDQVRCDCSTRERQSLNAQSKVFDQVFPVWTYAQFVILLIMGFLSESMPSGYKFIVLLGIFGGIVENLLMIFGHGLLTMQVVEVVVALKFAGFHLLLLPWMLPKLNTS